MWKYVEEGIFGSKSICYLCQKEGSKISRENAAKQIKKRSAEKMKEVSLKKFKKELVSGFTVLANTPKVDKEEVH
ncbi:hypothetical protein TNIN_478281 [Trichonephila inaurata madagascariensis]|uniref:Uncharacterized protein n=1 Tax=Trichonephila inaurata madagascariensis TaxID=2747483 RepID=A0A8X6YGF8_9ARAC|nr:hypothetical protein TNIN_478281 [Trichonephila inaurata madagascariensis]